MWISRQKWEDLERRVITSDSRVTHLHEQVQGLARPDELMAQALAAQVESISILDRINALLARLSRRQKQQADDAEEAQADPAQRELDVNGPAPNKRDLYRLARERGHLR